MASLVSTWSFGLHAVKIGKTLLGEGLRAIDTCEESIAHVENDASMGLYFVGRGGCPNSDGQLQCDAALMDGSGLRFGGVAALERIPCPIRVARRVMDKCRHNFLVGQGAQTFAVDQGFQLESNESLIGDKSSFELLNMYYLCNSLHTLVFTPAMTPWASLYATERETLLRGSPLVAWLINTPEEWVTVLYLEEVCTQDLRLTHGQLPPAQALTEAVARSIGKDSAVGAACCTGDGDQISRFCPSHQVVRLMEHGLTPQKSCDQVVRDIAAKVGTMFEMGIIAMDKKGDVGASGSVTKWTDPKTHIAYPGFPYAVWSEKLYPEGTVLTKPCILT